MIYSCIQNNLQLLAKYRLYIIIRDTEVPSGSWENFTQVIYILFVRFLQILFAAR